MDPEIHRRGHQESGRIPKTSDVLWFGPDGAGGAGGANAFTNSD